jgi:hypothetical protein
MPDKPTSEQIRLEAVKLRGMATQLMEQSVALIAKAVELEKQISQLKHDDLKQRAS